jgi:hypothetical protein
MAALTPAFLVALLVSRIYTGEKVVYAWMITSDWENINWIATSPRKLL